jgi:SAM-dependent methyltransferase
VNQPQPHPATNPAQTYEEHCVPCLCRPWTPELLGRTKPQPGERVLDVACGTGIVARMIAQQLNGQGNVVGLDLNSAMVEVARATAAQEGLEIAWRGGTADDRVLLLARRRAPRGSVVDTFCTETRTCASDGGTGMIPGSTRRKLQIEIPSVMTDDGGCWRCWRIPSAEITHPRT